MKKPGIVQPYNIYGIIVPGYTTNSS